MTSKSAQPGDSQRDATQPDMVPDEFAAESPSDQAFADNLGALMRGSDSSHATSAELPLPHDLGEFRLIETLGEGGMGSVYRARHLRLRRDFAVKLLSSERFQSPTMLARFEREMQAVGRLSHPNIVQATHAGTHAGRPFLAMELLTGPTLSQLVRQNGPLPVGEACDYIAQAARALEHAQQQRLVHRDIKPSNLMLHHGRVKVLDYGLAMTAADDSDPDAGDRSELTATGQVMGTAEYMAPEQAHDTHSVDIRADLYSLGGTFFFLLTGASPFGHVKNSGPMSRVLAHINEPVPRVRDRRPDVPVAVATIVARLLAKKPEDRFQSPTDLLAALNAVQPQTERTDVEFTMSSATTIELATAKMAVRHARVWMVTSGILAVIALAVWANRSNQPASSKAEVEDLKSQISNFKSKNSLLKSEILNLKSLMPVAARPAGESIVTKSGLRARTFDREPLPEELRALANDITANSTRDPLDKTVRAWREQLIAARVQHAGTPAALELSRLLTHLPWPADALQREKIDAYELNVSGDGDPAHAPAELVAILGDSRLKHWTDHEQAARVLVTPDDKTIITSSPDGTVRFWDMETKQQRRVLRFDREVWGAVLANDGKTLIVSVNSHPPMHFIDVETGQPTRDPGPHGGRIAVSPDGKTLVAGSRSGRILDLPSGDVRHELKGHTLEILDVAISADGRLAATSSSDRTARLWDTATGQELFVMKHDSAAPGGVEGVALSRDGQLLATATYDGVRLWQTETGSIAPVLAPPDGISWKSVAFSPDGQWLAAGRYQAGLVGIWNASTGERLKDLLCRDRADNTVWSVAFGSKGNQVIAATSGSGVKLWDREAGADLFERRGHDGSVNGMAISPDGATVATVAGDGLLKLWDLATQQDRLTIRVAEFNEKSPGEYEVTSVAFSPDGAFLATGDRTYRVKLWNATTGEFVREVRLHGNVIYSVAFSPDGQRIVSSSAHGRAANLMTSDVATGKLVVEIPEPNTSVSSIAVSPNGRVIASTNHVPPPLKVKLWDATSGVLLHEMPQPPSNENWHALAFSPDSQFVACCGYELAVYDVQAGELRRLLRGRVSYTECAVFDPDGQTLWSSHHDGTVRHWTLNPAPGKSSLLRTIPLGPPGGQVLQIALTPDGRHLVTLNGNGTMYVLRL